jgi:hypothetical protein
VPGPWRRPSRTLSEVWSPTGVPRCDPAGEDSTAEGHPLGGGGVTRGPGVGARGRREVYALTARNTLVWTQPTGHHAMEPLACATPDRLCGVPAHPRPVRSGWIGRSNFHRPVTPDSVRG